MNISNELQGFIEKNINLIEQDTKESWETVYSKLSDEQRGELTQVMLEIGIDPAEKLGYIPTFYLFHSPIKTYKIPDNVESIRDAAFFNCLSLTSIEIPDSVTSIGSSAFYYCTSLTSIVLGNSVESIGSHAFFYCDSLTEIKYLGTKKDAITKLNVQKKLWRRNSAISKIICTDGVIEL